MTFAHAFLTVSALLLLPAAAARADQIDARLDNLFLILRQTDSSAVANDVASKIWEIWLEHDDEQTQHRLAEGAAAMEHNPGKALAILSELVEQAPDFAEAWNKRATLYYLLGDYATSEKDIEKTLQLEPRHFGALSGLGLVYLARSEYLKARSAFEAVLLIYPHSSSTRRQIELIDKYLRRNTI